MILSNVNVFLHEVVVLFENKIISDDPKRPGKVLIKLGPYTYSIHKGDEKAFLKHMKMKETIPYRDLSRQEYEKLSRKLRMKIYSDEEIGGYSDKHGDFGMYHYNTEPKNRKAGIEGMLRQGRYWGMEKEKKEKASRSGRAAGGKVKPQGQIWEPCENCGKEPSYLPLHLCKSCWPK